MIVRKHAISAAGTLYNICTHKQETNVNTNHGMQQTNGKKKSKHTNPLALSPLKRNALSAPVSVVCVFGEHDHALFTSFASMIMHSSLLILYLH